MPTTYNNLFSNTHANSYLQISHSPQLAFKYLNLQSSTLPHLSNENAVAHRTLQVVEHSLDAPTTNSPQWRELG